MLEGLLLKGYGGFYFVEAEDQVYACSLRGRFRVKKQTFLPGDRVSITPLERSKGVIEAVLPRKNELLRPPIANVEQAVITFALKNPKPDLLLLDRILIQVLYAGIEPILCFNKQDLLSIAEADKLIAPYRAAGFQVIAVSADSGANLETLKSAIGGHLAVMAGPSGAGKSSLLNAIHTQLELETGELSRKVERGKHTTRRVELLKLAPQTYIADTPGFSSLYLPEEITEKADIIRYYPEFLPYAEECPFLSCLHWHERDCAVRDAVMRGELDSGRYERYTTFLTELKEREDVKYK